MEHLLHRLYGVDAPGTHPRTLHALFTLLSEDFTQRHAQKRAIAGTKCVQLSM